MFEVGALGKILNFEFWMEEEEQAGMPVSRELDEEVGELVEVVEFDLGDFAGVVAVDFCDAVGSGVAVFLGGDLVDIDSIFQPEDKFEVFGDDRIRGVLRERK